MGKISRSLFCLAIGVVAYSNLSLWSQYVPTGALGLPLTFGNLPVLALQILGMPLIIVGIILFAWGIYDWVEEGNKKEGSPTQPPQVSAGKT